MRKPNIHLKYNKSKVEVGMGNSTPHRPQSGGPVAHTACLLPFTLWDEDPKEDVIC